MRDEKRIPGIIAELEQVWKLYPDWRLGQLICNIGRAHGYNDPFYIEDDDILKELKNMRQAEK